VPYYAESSDSDDANLEAGHEQLVESLQKEIHKLTFQLSEAKRDDYTKFPTPAVNLHSSFGPGASPRRTMPSPASSSISSPSSLAPSTLPVSPSTRYRVKAPTPFGPATAAVVKHYGIDPSIHQSLKEVVNSQLRKNWLTTIMDMIEGDSTATTMIAQEFVNAMTKDLVANQV
jgi:hypothetical protein